MLSRIVDRYLDLRRAAGFGMVQQGYLLRSFVRFAVQLGEKHVHAKTAIAWAALAPSEGQRASRLAEVRRFARFARAEDVRHEIPPNHVFVPRTVRYAPFLFTDKHVTELVRRAAQLGPAGSLRPWTYCTLFSLLAVSGMRISGALALRLTDVTVDGLVIRETKFRKSRLVPLHPTASRGLARYLVRRGTLGSESVFVSLRGTRLRHARVNEVFLRLVRTMGIHPGPGEWGPRIHDLRHRFAVKVLENGATLRHVIDERMLALSTYMGHAQIESTFWYLHATPRVLTQVADACESLARDQRECG
jgi:integrase/recombinase XerD